MHEIPHIFYVRTYVHMYMYVAFSPYYVVHMLRTKNAAAAEFHCILLLRHVCSNMHSSSCTRERTLDVPQIKSLFVCHCAAFMYQNPKRFSSNRSSSVQGACARLNWVCSPFLKLLVCDLHMLRSTVVANDFGMGARRNVE